jgi:two-component system, NtrC family, nitrogen regulation sensor histidine kinase NtrY
VWDEPLYIAKWRDTELKNKLMIYKNFRISIFIRVIVIVLLSTGLAFVMTREALLFVPLALVLALIGSVISLIRYIEKANKDLTHFLLSIRQGAYTESYTSGNRGKYYDALSSAMNEVVNEFARLNEQKELHYQYLETLNENIGIAILSFDSNGKLLMMNSAARKLLPVPGLSNLTGLKDIDTHLYNAVTAIEPGQRVVVKTFIEEEQFQLGVQVKEVILQNKLIRIVLLQNLNVELEEKEIEAWQQLMRVLTHEIMNSVTPIISLTSAMREILSVNEGRRKDLNMLTEENLDDISSSLSTIASRSQGLLKFVNAYKEYSKTLETRQEKTDIVALISRIIDLLTPDLQKYQIRCNVHFLNKSIFAQADPVLIEQVLINLMRNAIEAVARDGTGSIEVTASLKVENLVRISVADNGAGIDPETMSRIFIPFFTTKPGGSGIGLSLSRQIMKLHNGFIRVNSGVGSGSVFTMEWK